MASGPWLTTEEFDVLRQIDTCMVANAIESFHVRLRNTGFADAGIREYDIQPVMLGTDFFDELPDVGEIAGIRLHHHRGRAQFLLRGSQVARALPGHDHLRALLLK